MFAGFNLQIDSNEMSLDSYYNYGEEMLNSNTTKVQNDLKSYICEAEYLDGSLMQKTWFPQVNANIFISHSHKDERLIVSLAGWLYKELEITSFVDSSIWGYAEDLLKIIDKEYCVKSQDADGSIIYNYEKRNCSTSHVHMMLSMALAKMIDKTECLFFVNTPSSILLSDTIGDTYTLSPWIYAELQMSEIIRHKKLKEYRPVIIEKFAKEMAALNIKYEAKLDHLTNLNSQDLLHLQQSVQKNTSRTSLDVLDMLYDYKGMLQQKLNE